MKFIIMSFKNFFKNSYYLYIFIFSIVCFFALLNFGYSGLKTSIIDHKNLGHDAWVYLSIANSGIIEISNDFRSARILTPLLAYLVGLLNNYLGVLNLTQLNLLLVNSIFFGSSIFIFGLYLQKLKLERLFLTSIFIISVNFATVNYLSQSLVEAGEVFFYILLLYFLEKKKYKFIPIIFFFGALNKILFLVGAGSILLYFQILQILSNPSKKLFLKLFIQNFLILILSILPFILIKIYIQDGFSSAFDAVSRHQTYVPNLNNIKGFFYVHILFLPFGLYGLWRYNKKIFNITTVIGIPILLFGVLIGADGVSWGRYLFSSCCFLLGIGCAYLINNNFKY